MAHIDRVFAVVCVSNLEQGTRWYAQLIGREADNIPIHGIHEWYFGSGGLQLMQDTDRAGKSLFTFLVPDIEANREELKSKGMMLVSSSTADFAKVAQMTDEDGNVITFAQPTPERASADGEG